MYIHNLHQLQAAYAQHKRHRISVARALGQKEIDADVTVWKAVGPFPWEQAATASRMRHQPA
jgi:hypothetical protein